MATSSHGISSRAALCRTASCEESFTGQPFAGPLLAEEAFTGNPLQDRPYRIPCRNTPFKAPCPKVSRSPQTVGAYGEEVPPVLISNTAVKLLCADNTWLATARDDKSVPTP